MPAKKPRKMTAAQREEHAAKVRAGRAQAAHNRGEHPSFVAGCPLCVSAKHDTILDVPSAAPEQQHVGMSGNALLPGTVTPKPDPSDVYAASVDPNSADRERQHAAAIEAGRRVDAEARSNLLPTIGDEDGDLVFHVLQDGFTVLSKVWFLGETIRIARGSALDAAAKDTTGRAFYEMGESEQMARYGKVMFRPGAWPGESLPPGMLTEAGYLQALEADDHEAIERHKKAKQRQPISVSAVVGG